MNLGGFFFDRYLNLLAQTHYTIIGIIFLESRIPDLTGWRSPDREEERDMVCLSYVDILSESAFRAMGKVVRRYRERVIPACYSIL